MKVKSLSRVRLLVTPWTVAYQALPSMGFFQARVLEWVAISISKHTSNYQFAFVKFIVLFETYYSECNPQTTKVVATQSLLETHDLRLHLGAAQSESEF